MNSPRRIETRICPNDFFADNLLTRYQSAMTTVAATNYSTIVATYRSALKSAADLATSSDSTDIRNFRMGCAPHHQAAGASSSVPTPVATGTTIGPTAQFRQHKNEPPATTFNGAGAGAGPFDATMTKNVVYMRAPNPRYESPDNPEERTVVHNANRHADRHCCFNQPPQPKWIDVYLYTTEAITGALIYDAMSGLPIDDSGRARVGSKYEDQLFKMRVSNNRFAFFQSKDVYERVFNK